MIKDNPLFIFKEQNPHVTWESLRNDTGVAKWTLEIIAKKKPIQVLTMTIRTCLRIKKATGVDMLQWYFDKVEKI